MSLASILQALKQGDFQSRWEIAKQAEHWDAAMAVPLLVQVLDDPNTDIELQWFIAKILGVFSSADAALVLSQLLERSGDEEVRLMAAQSLSRFGAQAIEPLQSYLHDPQRQATALRALGLIEHPEVVPLLVEAAQTGTSQLRICALEALEKFQSPEILPLLVATLAHPDPMLRKTAISGLATRIEEGNRDALAKHFIPLLEDDNEWVADQAARALGRIATDSCTTALVDKCTNQATASSLQRTLIQCLGWIHSEAAIGGLERIGTLQMQNPDLPELLLQDVIASFASAAGTTVQTLAGQVLINWVKSDAFAARPLLRSRAILALGQLLMPTQIPDLIDLLADSDYGVQLHVIAALKQLSPQMAYTAIQERLKADSTNAQLAQGLAIAVQEW
ncbi:MAG TPA: HEAT repeat domain-containing protein [Stenomitos sp.]